MRQSKLERSEARFDETTARLIRAFQRTPVFELRDRQGAPSDGVYIPKGGLKPTPAGKGIPLAPILSWLDGTESLYLPIIFDPNEYFGATPAPTRGALWTAHHLIRFGFWRQGRLFVMPVWDSVFDGTWERDYREHEFERFAPYIERMEQLLANR